MKKGAIIALIALATSVAVYAGNGKKNQSTKQKQKQNVATKQNVVQQELLLASRSFLRSEPNGSLLFLRPFNCFNVLLSNGDVARN